MNDDRAKEIADGLAAAARSGYDVEVFRGSFHRGGVVKPSPYATIHEWGSGPLDKALAMDSAAFARLTWNVLALSGTNVSHWLFPVHDPPVAWKVTDHPYAHLGIPVIACPGIPGDRVLFTGTSAEPRYMDPEPVLLEAEPGRRP